MMPAVPEAITVRVPMAFRKRGGRKRVVAPDGEEFIPAARRPERIDSTLVKALARAFRWRKLLESGRYATIEELAGAEKINASYVSRVFRLTLLAPDVVEAILDGRQPVGTTLRGLIKAFPVAWNEQRTTLSAVAEEAQLPEAPKCVTAYPTRSVGHDLKRGRPSRGAMYTG